MNRKLIKLDDFLSANGMKINETKTEYLLLKPKGKKVSGNVDVCYKNYLLKSTNVTKMLGFYIDNTLSFSNHIEVIIRTKLRKFIPI